MNPKFASYFGGALGAIDGTHINCCPSASEVDGARNRKGNLTQNCLAACTWDMRFVYFISGWEGAAADGAMYARARVTDLFIPPGNFNSIADFSMLIIVIGRYYIADAGFALCDTLLTPYRKVRYHLKEWGRAAVR